MQSVAEASATIARATAVATVVRACNLRRDSPRRAPFLPEEHRHQLRLNDVNPDWTAPIKEALERALWMVPGGRAGLP